MPQAYNKPSLERSRLLASYTPINNTSTIKVLANVLLILMTVWMFHWLATAGEQLEWPDAPVEMRSIAIALSEVYHGSKQHVGYENLYSEMEKAKGISMDKRLAKASKWSPALGETPTFFLRDGLGHGYIEYAKLAFRLFGANCAALYLLYAILFSTSIILCIYRFHNRLEVIGLLLLTVTCMHVILSQGWIFPLKEFDRIYCIRFLSSLAIIPGLCLCFIVMDDTQFSWNSLICVIGQAAILGFVCQIRETAYMVVVAILCCAFISWLWNRKYHSPERVRSIAYYVATVIILIFFINTYSYLSMSWKYRNEYGTKTVVWHRLFISLGANPKWPLPQLKAQAKCPGIEKGMIPGIMDINAQYQFCSYLISKGRNSPQEFIYLLYSKEYENVIRNAFFQIILDHPIFVAETFFIYKPKLMVDTFKWTLGRIHWSMSKWETAIVLLALITAAICIYIGTLAWLWIIWTGVVAMWISSVVPSLLGWASPHTFYDAIWLTTVLLLLAHFGWGLHLCASWRATGKPM